MKTLLLTDLHGEDPSNLISVYSQTKKINRVGLLGDIDLPQVLQKILEATKRLNLPLIHSIGNHDFGHIRGINPRSSLMNEKLNYPKLWESFPNERNYIINAIAGKIPAAGLVVPDPVDKRLIYAHASIVNIDVREREVPDLLEMRLGLGDTEEKEANFRAMQQKGVRLFFRGHDHNRALLSMDINGKLKQNYFPYGKYKIDLENSFTIATIGTYHRGMHAIYDSESQELEFIGKGEE